MHTPSRKNILKCTLFSNKASFEPSLPELILNTTFIMVISLDNENRRCKNVRKINRKKWNRRRSSTSTSSSCSYSSYSSSSDKESNSKKKRKLPKKTRNFPTQGKESDKSDKMEN